MVLRSATMGELFLKSAVKIIPHRSEQKYKEFLLDMLPGQGQWTEAKYLWLTDRVSRLVEFTDGAIEALPTPTDYR